jgi:hypothetical protein
MSFSLKIFFIHQRSTHLNAIGSDCGKRSSIRNVAAQTHVGPSKDSLFWIDVLQTLLRFFNSFASRGWIGPIGHRTQRASTPKKHGLNQRKREKREEKGRRGEDRRDGREGEGVCLHIEGEGGYLESPLAVVMDMEMNLDHSKAASVGA